jgi:hypothetical protein
VEANSLHLLVSRWSDGTNVDNHSSTALTIVISTSALDMATGGGPGGQKSCWSVTLERIQPSGREPSLVPEVQHLPRVCGGDQGVTTLNDLIIGVDEVIRLVLVSNTTTDPAMKQDDDSSARLGGATDRTMVFEYGIATRLFNGVSSDWSYVGNCVGMKTARGRDWTWTMPTSRLKTDDNV